jgi:hypothetical protein
MLCAALFISSYYLKFMNNMALQLSYTHKEIINLIQDIKSSTELEEIKSLLSTYFSDKVTREADKEFADKNYTDDIFEKWKKEHFRKRA